MAIPEDPPFAAVPITRSIDVRVRFQWDGSTWTDESTNLISANGALETIPPNESYHGGKQVIQQATIVLANQDRRYSIDNTASPLYTYLQNNGIYRRKCKIEVQIGGTWHMVFLGYIKRIPKDSPLANQVTFTIWDIGEIARARKSTEVLRDWFEHDVVKYYLELAGLTDGVDFISPAYASAHSVAATIDSSDIVVPHSWLDEEPVWDELIDLASASGSKIYANKDGMIYFERGWRWSAPYFTETLTYGDYTDYDATIDDKGFYDKVTVGYTPRSLGDSNTELWSLAPNKVIAPGATEKIEARLRYAATSFQAPSGYYLSSLTGKDLSGSCDFGPVEYFAQQVNISVTNNASEAVILGKLKILGRPLLGQPSEQVKGDIGTIPYDKTLEVRENPYVQSQLQSEIVRDFMIWWHGSMKTTYTIKKARGVPTRRLMQRIQFDTISGTKSFIVTRIAWNIQVATDLINYTQDIVGIVDVFREGASNGYFILGTDTLGGNKPLWI